MRKNRHRARVPTLKFGIGLAVEMNDSSYRLPIRIGLLPLEIVVDKLNATPWCLARDNIRGLSLRTAVHTIKMLRGLHRRFLPTHRHAIRCNLRLEVRWRRRSRHCWHGNNIRQSGAAFIFIQYGNGIENFCGWTVVE